MQMKVLDNFLSNLSDHELAIFFGFRYDTFLYKSKEKIDNKKLPIINSTMSKDKPQR